MMDRVRHSRRLTMEACDLGDSKRPPKPEEGGRGSLEAAEMCGMKRCGSGDEALGLGRRKRERKGA